VGAAYARLWGQTARIESGGDADRLRYVAIRLNL
jgi:hypothetical protein